MKRFIIVDDDPFNNIICKFMIQKFCNDADVQEFTEPEEALATIETNYVDTDGTIRTYLFLDINMPSMSGWEFLEIYKDFSEGIHNQFTIYILSSSIDDRDILNAENHPLIAGFISKPLSLPSLEEIFGKVVSDEEANTQSLKHC